MQDSSNSSAAQTQPSERQRRQNQAIPLTVEIPNIMPNNNRTSILTANHQDSFTQRVTRGSTVASAPERRNSPDISIHIINSSTSVEEQSRFSINQNISGLHDNLSNDSTTIFLLADSITSNRNRRRNSVSTATTATIETDNQNFQLQVRIKSERRHTI